MPVPEHRRLIEKTSVLVGYKSHYSPLQPDPVRQLVLDLAQKAHVCIIITHAAVMFQLFSDGLPGLTQGIFKRHKAETAHGSCSTFGNPFKFAQGISHPLPV